MAVGAATPFIGARDEGFAAWLREARDASEERLELLLGTHQLDAPPIPADLALRWLARQCVERTVDEFDAVVVFTGEEGISKSMAALRLQKEIAAYRKVPWDWRALCYKADDVLSAYERAEASGEVSEPVWYDEGTRDLLAGETFEPEQEALTTGLTLLREVGVILTVCIPSIHLLAKKVRNRRATFWVHIESRGTRRRPKPSEGRLFERDARLRFKNDDYLGLQESLRCPRVRYDPYPKTDPDLMHYKALKKGNMGSFIREEREKLALLALKRATQDEKIRQAAEKLGILTDAHPQAKVDRPLPNVGQLSDP